MQLIWGPHRGSNWPLASPTPPWNGGPSDVVGILVVLVVVVGKHTQPCYKSYLNHKIFMS